MYMKNGTPTRDVTTPMCRETALSRSLQTMAAARSISAPQTADIGIRNLWSSPTSMRAMCGPTSPTNPIVPAKLTARAVTAETARSTFLLSRPTSTPRLLALESPILRAVSLQKFMAKNTAAIAMTTAIISRSTHSVLSRLPNIQNIMALALSLDETDWISETRDWNRKSMATPSRMIVFLSPERDLATE